MRKAAFAQRVPHRTATRCVSIALSFVLIAAAGAAALGGEAAAGPTAAISSPQHSAIITGDAASVTVLFDAGTDAKVTAAELYVDGELHDSAAISPPAASGSCRLAWHCTDFKPGKHTLTARVYDSTGHSRAVDVEVLLQAPARDGGEPTRVRIIAPSEGEEISGLTQVRVQTDESRIRYVMLLIDDVFVALTNMPPFTYALNTARYANGPHTLRATAFDLGDERIESPVVHVIINNPGGRTEMRAPAATATTPPATIPAATAAPAVIVPSAAAAVSPPPAASAPPEPTASIPAAPAATAADVSPVTAVAGSNAAAIGKPAGTSLATPGAAVSATAPQHPAPGFHGTLPVVAAPAMAATASPVRAAPAVEVNPVVKAAAAAEVAPATAAAGAVTASPAAGHSRQPTFGAAVSPAGATGPAPIATASAQPAAGPPPAAFREAHATSAVGRASATVSGEAVMGYSWSEAAAERPVMPTSAVQIAAAPNASDALESVIAPAAATQAPEMRATTSFHGAVETVLIAAQPTAAISAEPRTSVEPASSPAIVTTARTRMAALPSSLSAEPAQVVSFMPPRPVDAAATVASPPVRVTALAPGIGEGLAAAPSAEIARSPKLAEAPVRIARAPSAGEAVSATLAERGEVIVHTVRPGEQLGDIAARYGVPAAAIARLNGLTEGNGLAPGARVRVPWESALVLDGQPLYTDVTLMREGGITLAPFRAIVEHSGGVVHWIAPRREVRALAFSRDIRVTIGSRVAVVDARDYMLETEAKLVRERTMVPLGLFSDALGFSVSFDPATGRIYLAAK